MGLPSGPPSSSVSYAENRDELDIALLRDNILSLLSPAVLTLRDLILQDRVPHFHASAEVKIKLRAAGQDQVLDAATIAKTARFLARGCSDFVSRHNVSTLNEFLQQSRLEDHSLPKAGTVTDGVSTHTTHRHTFKERYQHLMQTNEPLPGLTLDGSTRPLDMSGLVELAKDSLFKLSYLNDAYVEPPTVAPPATAEERYARYHRYYASGSSSGMTSRSTTPNVAPVFGDTPVGMPPSAFARPNDGNVDAFELLQSADLIPPELSAILSSLQSSTALPTRPDMPESTPQSLAIQSLPEVVDLTALESDEVDEYDPLSLQMDTAESDYEPDEPNPLPAAATPQGNSYAAAAGAEPPFQPQHTFVATRPPGDVGSGDRVTHRMMKRADRREARERQAKARLEVKVMQREQRITARKEAKRRKLEARSNRGKPAPTEAISLPPATSNASLRSGSAARQAVSIPPPPPGFAGLQSSAFGIPPVPPSPFGTPGFNALTRTQTMAPPIMPAPGIYYTPQAMPQVAPPPPASRTLAPGETCIVHDQFGNAYIARPVPPQVAPQIAPQMLPMRYLY